MMTAGDDVHADDYLNNSLHDDFAGDDVHADDYLNNSLHDDCLQVMTFTLTII